ncbi:MAG: serine hydrolase domain-containing protein [Clostridia bacterium]
MRQELKLSELIIVFSLLMIAGISVYYYVNTIERNKLNIRLYPIQAKLEQQSVSCIKNSPHWLEEVLNNTILTHNAPNTQIAYISPQGQLFHCEGGYLGIPLFSQKVTKSTRFRYASVSKLWTSDAVLDLVKQQKIELDTPVLSLLPIRSVPADQRITQITIKDLLLHRGGFNRTGLMGDEMFRSGQTPFCPTSLEKLAQLQLAFDPNTIFSYSNLGYCLLGEVIANQEVNSYQQVIEKKYALEKSGIYFLKNKRLDDEAKYRYIETSLTGYGDIYTAFDYPALASSAGLSGSASALAAQVRDMVKKPQPNILSQSDTSCDLTKLRDCYGYAMFPYQQNSNSLKVYFRDGTLLGMSSLVVVDDNGGVLTLLSSGQSALGQQQYDQTKMKIYQYLIHQYH